jgi:hypothetical protein
MFSMVVAPCAFVMVLSSSTLFNGCFGFFREGVVVVICGVLIEAQQGQVRLDLLTARK